MGARQSPVMLPSTHATPRHESGDLAPFNPPSTRQHPLTPATVPGSPAVPCSEYTHTHERKLKKGKNVPNYQIYGENKEPLETIEGGDFQVGALRGQGCKNQVRSESEISGSSYMYYTLVYVCPE